jgi:hypothetical protein
MPNYTHDYFNLRCTYDDALTKIASLERELAEVVEAAGRLLGHPYDNLLWGALESAVKKARGKR